MNCASFHPAANFLPVSNVRLCTTNCTSEMATTCEPCSDCGNSSSVARSTSYIHEIGRRSMECLPPVSHESQSWCTENMVETLPILKAPSSDETSRGVLCRSGQGDSSPYLGIC